MKIEKFATITVAHLALRAVFGYYVLIIMKMFPGFHFPLVSLGNSFKTHCSVSLHFLFLIARLREMEAGISVCVLVGSVRKL